MKNILIVDDEPAMHELYRDMFSLAQDRYDIEIQFDAAEALVRAHQKKFDLIILDIIMEPMAGDSLLVYLRKDSQTKDIPVLIASALNPAILRTLQTINHLTIIQKPFKAKDLFENLDRILN
ncbi:MAG: response regulator [Candidatus Omnitrophota bacterium]|nr:response regulator [Candidatus Omnitrophota bacterium]